MEYKIDEDELKEAIATVDSNSCGYIKLETFESLMKLYYENKTTGWTVPDLIKECVKNRNLHPGYLLAAFSFVGKHGGRPRYPEAKEVSKLLKENEEANKQTKHLQTFFLL